MSNGTIKNLIRGLEGVSVYGSKETEIQGLTANSKQVGPGFLFVAKKGGEKFISEAVQAGATVVVTDLLNPFLKNVVQIVTPYLEELELALAERFYRKPADQLFIAGVTGTNGKTTSVYLIRHLLGACGLIGTIEWIVGNTHLPSTHTTPDLLTVSKLFSEMVVQGCSSVAMEVSSHGLDQGRVRGISFDAAVFTNLTLDHLDYHKSMESYARAKAKLFTSLKPEGWAIYNIDDPWYAVVLKECHARRLSFGFSKEADLRASDLYLSAEGMHFHLHYQKNTYPVFSPLIGRFNVYNLLGAIGCALAKGMAIEKVVSSLKEFQKVPGRLERVSNQKGVHIFVDYAHTDDALRNVLETLSELKRGRVITVFGCGGDRDRTKRPKMAAVAEKFSDVVIVTSDNPRSEDPEEIARQVVEGFLCKSKAVIELDRKAAIFRALEIARPDDIVLIAGKGHERVQIFARHTMPFDDVAVALAAGQTV